MRGCHRRRCLLELCVLVLVGAMQLAAAAAAAATSADPTLTTASPTSTPGVESPAARGLPTSHFNGLRVISGNSYRAFTNRFRRHIKRAECLAFHAAGDWWQYEWCLGRHVRQFHVPAPGEHDKKPTTTAKTKTKGAEGEWSIVLGRFVAAESRSLRVAAVPELARLRDPEAQGYMAIQSYAHGDVCGGHDADADPDTEAGAGAEGAASQRPRRHVAIQYKCCVFRANETYIEGVDEPTTCAYVLRVCTPVACGLLHRDQYIHGAPARVSDDERRALAQTVREMFYHAYHGYLAHAFPLDALRPLSCTGESFELGKIPMLTLIDTLDTLAVLEDGPEFTRAIGLVLERATFDLDVEVSVFETTIRVLGGLLSAHLLATDAQLGLVAPGAYDGGLLRLALDLGTRLLPAFNTTTGIPYGTVNLRQGVPRGETPIASTAGAGSLSMEFTMLSVLTQDRRFATAARRAARGLFARRSRLGLVGKHIDTRTGEWTETISGPGSNSDSFYEYLWKMYVAFGDREALDMFTEAYPAVLTRNGHGDWFTDVSMWSGCGASAGVVSESLVSFWPGMQATMGDIERAARGANAIYRIWREYGFVPEQFNVFKWRPVRGRAARYPLRPELIESTFYLHEATNDSSWLRAGAHFVHSLQKHTRTTCGYATVQDIETKALEDNMPSFFLSETCKYLYLLFNTSHFVRNGRYVMTTEAHPFPILPTKLVAPMLVPTASEDEEEKAETNKTTTTPAQRRRRKRPRHRLWARQCPVPRFWEPLSYDVDFDAYVVEQTEPCRLPTSTIADRVVPDTGGGASGAGAGGTAGAGGSFFDDWMPTIERHLREQLERLKRSAALEQAIDDDEAASESVATDVAPTNEATDAGDGKTTSEFIHGGTLGLFRIDHTDGGIMRVTREDTGEWLESTGLLDTRYIVLSWLPERRGLPRRTRRRHESNEHKVHDQDDDSDDGEVIDREEELPSLLPVHRVYDFMFGRQRFAERRVCRINVHVPAGPVPPVTNPYKTSDTTTTETATGTTETKTFVLSCMGAGFGIYASAINSQQTPPLQMVLAEPLDACGPLQNRPELIRDRIVLVKRGTCFFETKALNADRAGAAGVIVVNHEDEDRVMVMSGSGEPMAASRETVGIPSVMIPRRAGEWLHRQLVRTQGRVTADIELLVRSRQEDRELFTTYVATTGGADKDPEDRRDRTDEASDTQSLVRRVYPRMNGVGSTLRLWAPTWGLEVTSSRLALVGIQTDPPLPEDPNETDEIVLQIVPGPPQLSRHELQDARIGP